MKTVDRYLSAVKTFLPKGQERDIIDELADSIHSKIEDREAQLGRPLSEAELEAMLKQLGHPALVAGRYGPQHGGSLAFGRQLIGPVLFPLYLRVLGLVLGISATICLVAIVLLGAGLSVLASTILEQLLIQFGIITLIFSLYQAHLTRHPDAWSPRDPLSPEPVIQDPRYAKLGEALFELGVLVAVLFWLRSAPAPAGSIVAGLRLEPIWGQLYMPALLLVVAGMASPVLTLLDQERMARAASIAVDACWVVLLFYLLSAGLWVAQPADQPSADLARLASSVNTSIFYSILIALGICGWQLFSSVRKLRRS